MPIVHYALQTNPTLNWPQPLEIDAYPRTVNKPNFVSKTLAHCTQQIATGFQW